MNENSSVEISSALKWLKSYRSDYDNRWLMESHGVRSGSGGSILEFIDDRLDLLWGSKHEYGVCVVETLDSSYPKCSKDRRFSSNVADPSILRGHLGLFNIWLPKMDILKTGRSSGGILLKEGGALPVNDEYNLVVPVYSGSEQLGLSEDALKIYIASHLFGIAASVEFISNNLNPYDECEYIFSVFTCDRGERGVYASTGVILRDMASECLNCSDQDLALLYYIAADYLLRSPSDSKVVSAGYKIVLLMEEEFLSYDFDTDALITKHRYFLSSK